MADTNVEKSKRALLRSIRDLLPGLVRWGVGVAGIAWLGGRWPWLGKTGFLVYALVLASETLRLLSAAGTAVATLAAAVIDRQDSPSARSQALSWLAIGVRLVRTAVIAVYTYLLYYWFWSPALPSIAV